MRSGAGLALLAITAAALPARVPAADLELEGRPLLAELGRPRYAENRCLLPLLLADDGRVVIRSPDPAFEPDDVVTAVDGIALDPSSRTALIDVLEKTAPSAVVTLAVRRRNAEVVVTAHCGQSKPYYDTLRSAAAAAVAGDGAGCDDALGRAAKMHELASVWLRLSLSCRLAAGRLKGDAVWRAEADLYRQRILEVRSTPGGLKRLRHGVLSAIRDLKAHGDSPLAEDLERHYAAALADGQRPTDDDD